MNRFPISTLKEVVVPVERPVAPVPGEQYRQVGVQLWGRGAYERERLDGGRTKYNTLSRVENNDIIINKIWARNGSVAVVQSPLAGCFVSNEFPTFRPITDRLEPRWFHWLTKTYAFWQQCDEKSRGTSGKNRIRPEKFLEIEIPLPSLPEQRRIVTRIDELSAKVEEAHHLKHDAAAELDAFFVSKRSKLFQEAAESGLVRLDELCTLERGKFSHRPRNDPRFFGGPHPWIQIGEIESSKKRITKWSETLNENGLAISRKFPKGHYL